MAKAQYRIGIDLGTTNSTVTFTSTQEPEKGEAHELRAFPVPQISAAGEQAHQLSLPSFVYFPLPEELDAGNCALTWDPDRSFCVGRHARDRGGELPDRLVSSAKSWLCHDGVDRREAILPIEADDEAQKVSPLVACTQFLEHLRQAWNDEHPNAPFEEQEVLVTVPASFDPSARQLVQEAAEDAGYPDTRLLEEPLAAFYAWLHAHHDSWRDTLTVNDTILVVDIGGGTTDFSLIRVKDEDGDLGLERIAVGAHLLLGGDNMDLALAYTAKAKLEADGHAVDAWQMKALILQCRTAKEQLLSVDAPETVEVTIQGRGRKLIGNSVTTELTQQEAHGLLVDGFAPLVPATERSEKELRTGLQQVGLPYARDPRITCQLAKFLSQTGEEDSMSMEHFIQPTHVLFNGGTLHAAALRARLLEQLNQWAAELKAPEVLELPGADYDRAVSRGAAYYAVAREGGAIRIKGGTSRSYWIAVEEAMPAIPGLKPKTRAVCVVPFGLEEGSEVELAEQSFNLLVGERVRFRFLSRETASLADGQEAVVGMELQSWESELSELHPIEADLESSDGVRQSVTVHLKARVTELGVLELIAAAEGREWRLEFDIREDKLQPV